MSTNPITSPREHFRWALQEQYRTRQPVLGDIDEQKVISGAMDAFDWVWRRYGLNGLNINIGPPFAKDDKSELEWPV